jgi:hypothetical protein
MNDIDLIGKKMTYLLDSLRMGQRTALTFARGVIA